MRRLLVHLTAVALLAAGCQARGGVTVVMDEYTLEPDPSAAKAGTITFTAENEGDIAHQLLVLRTRRDAGDLPTSKQGIVRVGRGGVERAGEIALVAPGESEPASLDLTAGTYVLICNIAGHYTNGMRAGFRVS
jgi:uncharacterized cupredoxin-like copper-binding protein